MNKAEILRDENGFVANEICEICEKPFWKGRCEVTTCSPKCVRKKYYKNNKEDIIKRVKDWQEINPDKLKEYRKHRSDPDKLKADYLKNRVRWTERSFVIKHKQKVLAILGEKCKGVNCKSPMAIIYHTRYKGLKRYHNNLIKYCNFLKPLCIKCKLKEKRAGK